jgi:hypothetical protein
MSLADELLADLEELGGDEAEDVKDPSLVADGAEEAEKMRKFFGLETIRPQMTDVHRSFLVSCSQAPTSEQCD